MAEDARLALERACAALGNPSTHAEAERVILAFHSMSDPIPACLHVLQKSQAVDAVFQATIALRKACINNGWSQLPPNDKLELRVWVLQFLVHHGKAGGHGPMAPVLQTMLETHAIILKLLWTELAQDQVCAFVQEICSQAQQQTEDTAMYHRALAAVVTEFNPATASSSGLPWATHERCRQQFEATLLEAVFRSASGVAMAAPLEGPPPQHLSEAVGLTSTCLAWGFQRGDGNAGPSGFHSAAQRTAGATADPTADLVAARAPDHWLALALAPPLRQWVVGALRAHASAAAGAQHGAARGALATRLRQVLVQMCLLTPWEARGGGSAEIAELGVRGLLEVLQPGDAFVATAERSGNEDAVRDAAKAAAALFRMVPAARAEAAVGAELLLQLWAPLARATVDLLARGGASVDFATDWQGVSTGLLLDMWTRLLSQLQVGAALGGSGTASPRVGAAVRECARDVFAALLRAQLEEYASGAEADAEDDAAAEAAEEWEALSLDQAAALARSCLPSALRGLHAALSSTAAALLATAGSGGAPAAAAVLEQLWWLLRVSAAVAADDAAGETPLIPVEVEMLVEAGDPSAELLPQIGKIIGEVAAMPTGPGKALASPRLMEAALWALARWTDTYGYAAAGPGVLEVEEGGPVESPSAAARLLAPPDVAAAATLTLSAVVACVTQYPGETALHTVAVQRLLRAVVCRPGRSGHLQQVPAWRELLQAFAAAPLPGAFAGLHSRLHRPLAAAACSYAAGFRALDRPGKLDMLHGLLQSTLAEVAQHAPPPDNGHAQNAAAASAANVERLAVALERLRGAVEGANLADNCVVYDAVLPCLPALLHARCVFAAQPLVQRLLLQLATALASSHSGTLHHEAAERLSSWSLQLLTDFAAAQQRAATERGGQAQHAQQEEEAERAELFQAAFELVLYLAELLDHIGADAVVESIFQGCQALLTAVPPAVLAYPAVADVCATAVLKICEFHAARVLRLPPAHFNALADVLLWGLQQPSVHTANLALRALGELTAQHMDEVAAGQSGLSSRTTADDKPLVPRLLAAVLAMLRHVRPADVLSAAAEALRPLVATAPDAFGAAVTQLLPPDAWTSPLQQEAAAHAEKLRAAAGGASARAFEMAFAEFVVLLRRAMHGT
eukprot:jgi/Ulvmu1/8449/UM043_0027.1